MNDNQLAILTVAMDARKFALEKAVMLHLSQMHHGGGTLSDVDILATATAFELFLTAPAEKGETS